MIGCVILRVFVDSREPRQHYEFLVKAFPDHVFERKALPEGDYETEHVIVERKTITDLYGSIMGDRNKKGRFPNQINRLSCHDQIVILLVTGNMGEFLQNMKKLGVNVDVKIIYGAIASVSCREHIHVMWIDREWDALVAMITFMQKVDDGKYGVPSKRDPDILVTRYLKLTPRQWKDMKAKFGSLMAIATASEKDLMTINGIGKVKAKGIKDALCGSW